MNTETESSRNDRQTDSWQFVFVKGMMMGSVELVPGVSAGTIALISGILPRLLDALRKVNFSLLIVLKKQGLVGTWQYLDGNFLVLLALGMVSGVALLVQGISFSLENYPIWIWSFFFGLIFASSLWLAKQIPKWKRPDTLLMFLVGLSFALYITLASPVRIELSLPVALVAGALTISAMMMPGLSGSFMLMLAGLYTPILAALKALEFSVIAAFMAGAIIGVLAFSHILSFMFRRFPGQIYALLTGVMLGSLNQIWPWKEVIQFRTNSAGEQEPMLFRSVSPEYFSQINGEPHQLIYAVFFAFLGVVLVVSMSKLEGLLLKVDGQESTEDIANVSS